MNDNEEAQARALGRWCAKHECGFSRVALPNGLHVSGCPECVKGSPLADLDPHALIEAARKAKEDRAERMPDEQAALRVLHDGYTRLKELGWRDATYAPRDGSYFDVIEAGSIGIHACTWLSWDTGGGFFINGEDPSRPILYRVQS